MTSLGRELEVTIASAKDIKNVNWRNGRNKPYAVLWVDPRYKSSTRVDEEGDTCPSWNETFVIPLFPDNNHDDKVYIDVVHAGREENTKPLIGSAHLSLRDVVDDVGLGVPVTKTLELKRPSGRPHGKLNVTITVREPRYHPAPQPYHAPVYGYSNAPSQPVYNDPYAPPQSYGNTVYGQPGYGYAAEKEKGSKFGGMGTGLAVGALAGVLGGVALAEGLEAVEDNIAEEAAEKVEDDLDAGEDDFDCGDDGGDF